MHAHPLTRGRSHRVAPIAERVLITGALGFIGRALAERYLSDGAEVRGVDLTPDPDRGVIAGDVARAGPWQRHAEGCDLVIHAAATVSLRRGPGFWEANVLGTRNALEAATRAGAARFLHISSVTVYGFDLPAEVNETHPVRPNGVPYVDTKIASEQVVLQAHAAGEVPCTIVRPGDVYGPGSRPWTILPVEEIAARRFVLPAMGRGVFTPVYIDNLVDGIVRAAAAPAAFGRVFNLTDGADLEARRFFAHYYSMLGRGRPWVAPTLVARELARLASAAGRARGAATEVTPAAVDYLCRRAGYSIDRARSALGYEPSIGLDEGMTRTESWLREARLI